MAHPLTVAVYVISAGRPIAAVFIIYEVILKVPAQRLVHLLVCWGRQWDSDQMGRGGKNRPGTRTSSGFVVPRRCRRPLFSRDWRAFSNKEARLTIHGPSVGHGGAKRKRRAGDATTRTHECCLAVWIHSPATRGKRGPRMRRAAQGDSCAPTETASVTAPRSFLRQAFAASSRSKHLCENKR